MAEIGIRAQSRTNKRIAAQILTEYLQERNQSHATVTVRDVLTYFDGKLSEIEQNQLIYGIRCTPQHLHGFGVQWKKTRERAPYDPDTKYRPVLYRVWLVQ